MAAKIEIRDVSKVFDPVRLGEDRVHAFGPVDLDRRAGEFVSLARSFGLRKVDPDADDRGPAAADRTARSGSTAASVTEPRTDIGIMFQDNTLVPWRTVRGNIELQLELRGLDPRRYAERIVGLLRIGPARRLREPAALRAFGRHAAARRLLPGAGARARDAASRRAARQARRDDPREHPPRPAGALDGEAARPSSSSRTASRRRCSSRRRVCVITPRPGRIDTVIDIDLPWPRDLDVKTRPGLRRLCRPRSTEIFHGYGVL